MTQMAAHGRAVHASTSWRWAFVVAIAGLLLLGTLAYVEYRRLTAAIGRVEHTYAVLEAVDGIVQRLVDAETAHRGYLLTQALPFLDPYNGVDREVRTRLDALDTLVRDNAAQTSVAARLRTLCDSKIDEMATVLRLNDSGDREGALARIRAGEGKRVMDDLRQTIDEMRGTEQSLLAQRSLQAALARRAAAGLGVATLAVALALGFVGLIVERNFERRQAVYLRESSARLDAQRVASEASGHLRDSEQFNKTVLDHSADCITLIDRDGSTVLINEPGCRQLDLTTDEVTGRPWATLWGNASLPAQQAMATATTRGEARFQALRPSAQHGPRWWDVVVTAVRQDDGSTRRLVAVARDVTVQKRAEEERTQLLASERAARSEAERAARLKDEFVGTLSHELRTPLNAIMGWVRVLRQDQSPTTLAKAIDVIDRNSRRQSQMVDDLLDMSRIISGKLRLDVQRIEMATVIEEAVASAQPAADAKGVRLVQVLGSAAIIQGDPGRLQQVIWNLVSNAIKFTPRDGRVQITLRKVKSHVEVQVSDTGIGMPPELVPVVFQRFRQGDAAAGRQDGGLGLGLAIVKSLVEMHGGSVEAASEGRGLGSVFVVRLPLSLASNRPDIVEEPLDLTPVVVGRLLRGVTVLVVEDEPDARDLLQRFLEDAGAAATITASADEALTLLQKGLTPDVILSDIGMPDLDGYDFMQRVRRLPGDVRDTPAAALTALARVEDRRRALLAGFQAHLAKPVDPSELVALVASLSGRTGRDSVDG